MPSANLLTIRCATANLTCEAVIYAATAQVITLWDSVTSGRATRGQNNVNGM